MLAVLAFLILAGKGVRITAAADDQRVNPRGGRPAASLVRNWLILLRSEAVQRELKLTDDQKESISKLGDNARASLKRVNGQERQKKAQELRNDWEVKVSDILSDQQKVQLEEIVLQRMGAFAPANKDIAETLKLTDEQVNKIKELSDAFDKPAQAAFQPTVVVAGDSAPASPRDILPEKRKETDEKIMTLLTSDQKASLKKMQGARSTSPSKACSPPPAIAEETELRPLSVSSADRRN